MTRGKFCNKLADNFFWLGLGLLMLVIVLAVLDVTRVVTHTLIFAGFFIGLGRNILAWYISGLIYNDKEVKNG